MDDSSIGLQNTMQPPRGLLANTGDDPSSCPNWAVYDKARASRFLHATMYVRVKGEHVNMNAAYIQARLG